MLCELNYTIIGQRIQAARKKKHLTQEQLAAECQLSAAHIGHIERGTRIPSLEAVVRISEVLTVSLDELLLGAESNETDTLLRIGALLKTKNPVKVSAYLSVIQALADKIDDI